MAGGCHPEPTLVGGYSSVRRIEPPPARLLDDNGPRESWPPLRIETRYPRISDSPPPPCPKTASGRDGVGRGGCGPPVPQAPPISGWTRCSTSVSSAAGVKGRRLVGATASRRRRSTSPRPSGGAVAA
ncbi:hypothetical protein PVAP13_3NG237380 [Panicum virgatum]|uniref:Uncharacterized protein n=1 Tax=Panicum virgatum TaxID=38727 RepID=A0A8T0U2K3_PANVG|nr:hypothetical protein PVAP13_3NG237380 [Panicum virgatum]